MLKLIAVLISWIIFLGIPQFINQDTRLKGAWKSDNSILMFDSNFYSITSYHNKEFLYTQGGSWNTDNSTIKLSIEYDTQDSTRVGSIQQKSFTVHNDNIEFDGMTYKRIDDGTPGKLCGVWLFSNRVIDGNPGTPRDQDNPRKTMKILSGTRFQWIAYNVQTKEFFGTGGGTYTTVNGKYTENIDFFSRDPQRVGASLTFDFQLQGDDWHHKGLNSRGEPLYEIWTRRK